jgi:ABC-type bacteriocin/lantibiotic exporter with double-glycine peptidase domain
MFQNSKKIFLILNKKEKFKLSLISFFTILSILMETFSIALIIPVFDIIFFGKAEKYYFFNFFFSENIFLNEKNLKIFILILLLAAFLFKNIFLIFFHFLSTKFFYLINLRISKSLFNLYLNNNYNFFLNIKSDDFIRKVYNDAFGFREFLVSLQLILSELIFIFFLSFFLFIYNPLIFSFCLIIFSLILVTYSLFFKKRIAVWGKLYQQSIGDLHQLIIDGIRGIKDIIIYSIENRFHSQFDTANKNAIFSQFKLNFVNTIPRFFMELVAIFSLVVPLIFLVLIGFDIPTLIPIFALFAVSIFKVIPSINRLINSYNNFKYYSPSVDLCYNEIFTNPHEIHKFTNYDFYKSLEFKNVQYRYPKSGNFILNKINFIIKKNESLLIKGLNGSGKSTLLNIISGLITPSSGEILLDNKSVVLGKFWTKKISYIQQNIFLLNCSIKENITSSNCTNIDNDKFTRIDRILNLSEIFQLMPNSLDTIVGNNEKILSGGQRQIISIARALYKDSDLLIFDEADSAIDKNSRDTLKNLLLELKGKKTILFVTHDESFFKECFDEIYQISSGELILEK